MHTLELDLDRPPHFQRFTFKAGENHVKLTDATLNDLENNDYIKLLYRYSGDSSLFSLAMAVDAIRNENQSPIRLICPYFPGARQDRICERGEALSVGIYANFFNSLNLTSVHVYDPHSDVTAALLKNCKTFDNYLLVERVVCKTEKRAGQKEFIISPDAGANKKVFKLSQKLNIPFVRADKIRETKTGKILETQVITAPNQNLEGAVCYIADDLIAGGRTFMELAKKLKEIGADKVVLIVSHHEGHADEGQLFESGIDGVYTTNSLPNVKGTLLTDVFQMDWFNLNKEYI